MQLKFKKAKQNQPIAPAIAHESASWLEEKRAAYLYLILSDTESGTTRQLLFLELANAADEQAALWAQEIRKLGALVPNAYAPDQRTRFVGWLVRKLGPRAMRPILAAMKVRGMSLYTGSLPGHRTPVALSDVEKRQRHIGGGNLRAVVFGVNDGLVSNVSLILGVAGATGDAHIIVLTGTAGLLAGAFSMASGEFISVRSRREMLEYQIALEKAELEQYPQEEAAELALILEAKGLAKGEARQLADKIIADPDQALDTLAREELGLNPDELGSPVGAALLALISFAVGGLIPLIPYLFNNNYHLPGVIGLTGLALFAVGAALSLFTGRHALLGGIRMLAIGGAAGGASYLIGSALGVTLSLV
jgi:VIT1/CCC1 family predicted Fe2+/Mn2+ transporter